MDGLWGHPHFRKPPHDYMIYTRPLAPSLPLRLLWSAALQSLPSPSGECPAVVVSMAMGVPKNAWFFLGKIQ